MSLKVNSFFQTLPSGFSFEMIRVEKGSFIMGSEESDQYTISFEKSFHPVTITSDFFMGKYPVTQELWLEVMKGENPAYFKGLNRPVERISWFEAAVFCNRLSQLSGLTPVYYSDAKYTNPFASSIEDYKLINEGTVFILQSAYGFRLPSEAEWEYAARGGKQQKNYVFSGGDKLDDMGGYYFNSYGETKSVGLKTPNTLGLCDMSGNVWEWCNDHWHSDYKGAPHDGLAWLNKMDDDRVIRGGSWFNAPRNCRVTYRSSTHPSDRYSNIGFRLVLFPFQFRGSF